jgi:hypothetical protein
MGSPDAGRHVNEVSSDVAVRVKLLLSEEGFSRQADLLLFLNLAHHKDRVGVVAP